MAENNGDCSVSPTTFPPLTQFNTLEQLYLKVVEASPDAMVVVDVEGKIVVFNTQAEYLFGYSRAEVLSQYLEMLLPEGFREVHKTHFQTYLSEPRIREMGMGKQLLKGLHRTGKEFDVQIKLAPIIVAGAGIFALAIVRRVPSIKD